MKYKFDYTKHIDSLVPLFRIMEDLGQITPKKLAKVVKKHTKNSGNVFSKDELVMGYRNLAGKHGLKPIQKKLLDSIKMKPSRTQSGVAPITVLTKPFPCPGRCIFCPTDVRMPKSYLSNEPGAQRAERNSFDPYLQTYNRLQALHNIGHSVSKAELIVLGGTWSFYPEKYQIWFIKECFRALNDFGNNDDREKIESELSSKNYNQTSSWEELFTQQKINETASIRSVGLVIETRPDNISEQEVIRIRKLGCTKAQIGFQSLNDDVLKKNKRGHLVESTRRAVKLLRLAGFKIHAHWMANLYGSSVEDDKKDYEKLFADIDFKPDELKIYPCSLIASAELMEYFKKGLWKPYSYEELLEVLEFCLLNTPEYCRLTRVIRDIPSDDIVEGNKFTNFRQIAEQKLEKAGKKSQDIRAREIRNLSFDSKDLKLEEVRYKTSTSNEIFLQYVVSGDKVKGRFGHKIDDFGQNRNRIVAFLRLSFPTEKSFIKELEDSAIIREIHVYGMVVDVGKQSGEKSQHLGLGKKLIERAVEITLSEARESALEYKNLAVISAIGTKEYYRKRGFKDGDLYQFKNLKNF